MNKACLAAIALAGAATFFAPARAEPAPDAAPAAAAGEASGAKAAAATQTAGKKRVGFRKWWRNRQIERGPSALRPGHHRRLMREKR